MTTTRFTRCIEWLMATAMYQQLAEYSAATQAY
jgi:hypothetical protein